MIEAHNLAIDSVHFDLVNSGAVSHIVVDKDEGIEAGDYVLLQCYSKEVLSDVNEDKSLMVKVAYKDREGSGIEEGYCVLSVRRV